MHPRQTYVFVRRAEGWVPAGLLKVSAFGEEATSAFVYGPRYATRSDAIAIDPVHLPLPSRGQPHLPVPVTRGQGLFGGILDALPDGWGRGMLQKAHPRHVFDDFETLRASSDERIGALAFGPTLLGPDMDLKPTFAFCHENSLEVLQAMVVEAPDLDELTEAQKEVVPQLVAAGGARPKATLVDDEGRHWLAKFDAPRDQHDWQRIEHATMTLARGLGFPVTETRCMEVAGRRVFLIERFDRDNGPVGRVPFVSALTMTGAGELEARYTSYRDIAESARRHVSPAHVRADLQELFRRIALNAMVHNNDDHLRNHGFLHDGRGWRLSPLYDVVPRPTQAHDRFLAINVDDLNDATLSNVLSAARHFEYTPEQAAVVLEDLRLRLAATWESTFRACGCTETQLRAFQPCFRTATLADWNTAGPDRGAGPSPGVG